MTGVANDGGAVFRTIAETARLTGLSQSFIRAGVRAGTIPAIRVGGGANGTYFIDVALFLEQLHADAKRGARV